MNIDTKRPTPHTPTLRNQLRSLERPLSSKSLDLYLLRSDGALVRKFKPARRKKDRRKARIAAKAKGQTGGVA